MPKSGKQKNDLRGIRKETAVLFVAAAILCMGLYVFAVIRGMPHLLRLGGAMILIYLAVTLLIYYLLEKRRRIGTRDETLAPVMGRIMFDAVVKMSTPVFICDSAERIIWYNTATEALYSSKNKLYGELVSELFGVTLADIRSDRHEDGARLTCDNRTFLAKYNHIKTDDDDFALVTTTEITELDALTDKMEGDALAVCYILVDNLNEMMQYDSEQYRPAAAKIDGILRDWADEYGGILKEYERDKYLFLTETRVLEEIIARRFEILDRVRAVRVGDTNLPLTISMGVSAIHGSYEDKDRAASAALDMALQRGGDQAAVKGDGSIDFYGGVTKTVQKRTNVRARVVSNELIAAMKSASNVLVMGHQGADFDAVGACVGIARIAMTCGTPVQIVLNLADRNLSGCRAIIESEPDFRGIFVNASTGLDLLETGTLVVVADVNNLRNTEAPELAERTEKLVVIDHHRKTAEFEREPDIEYIDPSASATCEIVAEMLEQVLPKDDLSAAEANVMLAGITLDTNHFSKNTGTRTFSAAMYLRDRGANPTIVQNLFRESFDDYSREAKFRRNVEIYHGSCAITVVEDAENAGGSDAVIAAKAANNLLMVEGIHASFALIRMGDAVRISARSDGSINVQLIMEKVGGGGHFDSAAAQRNDRTVEEILADLKAAIDESLG